MTRHTKLDMDVDLERARALRVDLDLDRGSRALEATLAVIGVAAPVAGAAFAAKPITLLAKGALAKVLGALLLVGVASGVTLAVSTERNGTPATSVDPPVDPPVDLLGTRAVDSAGPREAEWRPPTPVPSSAALASSALPRSTADGESGPSSRTLARGPAGPAPREASGSRLADELRDVAAARELLATSPETALKRADAASGGPLDEERDIIGIRALVALGRPAEARARAERFLARHPDSAFRGTAEQVVASAAPTSALRAGESSSQTPHSASGAGSGH